MQHDPDDIDYNDELTDENVEVLEVKTDDKESLDGMSAMLFKALTPKSEDILKLIQEEDEQFFKVQKDETHLNPPDQRNSQALADPFDAAQYSTIGEAQIIQPPYNPRLLAYLFDISPSLGPCIEAMYTNIDGYGYDLVSTVKKMEDREKWKDEIEQERERLEDFFHYINSENDFIAFRKLLRKDLELTGNFYVEVLRYTDNSELQGFEYLPSITMRIGIRQHETQHIKIKKRVTTKGKMSYVDEVMPKRFRKFIQMSYSQAKKIWFKEYGDKRIMDSRTGEYLRGDNREYVYEDDFKQEDWPGIIKATEVIHLKIGSPTNDYGIPRWMGNLLSVLGERDADEVNKNFFEKGAIYDFCIMVSGGRLSGEATKNIKRMIEENRGKNNAHSILVLQSDQARDNIVPNLLSQNTPAKIEVLPMNKREDMMFENYMKSSSNRVRLSFRLPPLYLGKTEDYTNATARASKEVAEEQVFQPERNTFDFWINRWIMSELGAQFHFFKTKGPTMSRIDELETISKSFGQSVLTGRELRRIAAIALDIPLDDVDTATNVDQSWLNYPPMVVQWMIQNGLLLGMKQKPGGDPFDDEPIGWPPGEGSQKPNKPSNEKPNQQPKQPSQGSEDNKKQPETRDEEKPFSPT